jgi:chondroitin 4-sulfotransferase 11
MLDIAHVIPLSWRYRIADLRGRGVYAGYPNRHRCIFIHIPKTGGSAVADVLFGNKSRHVPYFEYEFANPNKFRRYFKFAFVRNPWDRLISTFFFLRGGGMNENDRLWSERNIAHYPNFGSFVRAWLTEENISTWVHFFPQSHFILDETGSVKVDFVGRFERLDEDFNLVAKKLGCQKSLPKKNVGEHKHFTSYYDNETREIVARVYARDIKSFGYEFIENGEQ